MALVASQGLLDPQNDKTPTQNERGLGSVVDWWAETTPINGRLSELYGLTLGSLSAHLSEGHSTIAA